MIHKLAPWVPFMRLAWHISERNHAWEAEQVKGGARIAAALV